MISPLWLTADAAMILFWVWIGHTLGTASPHRRGELHRALAHRRAAWCGAALLAIGVAASWIWSPSSAMPRRYADYLPADGGYGFSPVLGPPLAGIALVLLASWLRARLGGAAGGLGFIARHAPAIIGGLLVLAGVTMRLRLTIGVPESFTFYFSEAAEAENGLDAWALTLQPCLTVDIMATGVGLAVLAALAGHRLGAGRRHRSSTSDTQGE